MKIIIELVDINMQSTLGKNLNIFEINLADAISMNFHIGVAQKYKYKLE